MIQKLNIHNISSSDLLNALRSWLVDAQAVAKARFDASQDVEMLTLHLSSILDHLIGELFSYFSQTRKLTVSVVAVGSYGRREQCPFSDVDLLFLYAPSSASEAASIAESILYVLWDLGLKVGQAHRSVEETLMLAHDDMQIRTNLLDARLICGDKKLYRECIHRLWEEVITPNTLEFVDAKLAERDVRHARFGDSRYVLEPNVKEGKGGLRDLHTLWWLARHVYAIETLDELAARGLLNEDELATFRRANQFLLRVRVHLHYLVGHADERITFDNQHALAKAMGFHNPNANLAITRFMRRYFMIVSTVGSLTRIFCALLEDEKKRKPRKPLGWVKFTKEEEGAFELDGERLSITSDDLFEKKPLLMLTLFQLAQEQNLDIHPRALRCVTRNLHLINDTYRANEEANQIFLRILRSDKGPEITLRRMNEAGVLGRFIPDFGRIIGQTQFNMYHVYTVDEHTLVALGILHAIDSGSVVDEVPIASEIMPRITQKHVLYLALFCHDIAKGRGGDHSEMGERIAMKLAARFGFTPEECETTAWLVRNHLLLSNTAFKRDLNDPKTIADFVAIVRSPERLKLLLVLTVADIRAVAPAVWNEWKGALMRDLFQRAEQAMGGVVINSKQSRKAEMAEALRDILPTHSQQEIDEYMALGEANFWVSCHVLQHATIARMLMNEKPLARNLTIETSHDYKRSVTEIIICAPDQNGLFATLTGAITLAGATIITSKIFTLKNGTAVDIFQIQDIAGNPFDRPAKLAKMAVYMEQAISKTLDLEDALQARAKPYSITTRNMNSITGDAYIENDASNVCTVIEITGQDRVGLLYHIAIALADLNLSIVTAHISTYGAQVADVFYVKDIFGMKITHENRIKEVRKRLIAAL